jgi:glycosyltransferase involved in cell wall biosynthesis
MHVLSIIHHVGFGGPHNHNLRVIPLLEHLGIHTTVLLPDEPGNAAPRLRGAGIEVEQIPLSRLRLMVNPLVHLKYVGNLLREVDTIRHMIRARRIDLVQINGFINPQGAIAAKLERLPVVWQLLDDAAPFLVRLAMMPLVVWLADVLMTTGMEVARAHPRATSFGDQLITFFPPVDLSLFRPHPQTREAARDELGFAPYDFIVGTIGNINFQKNHLAFVRAAAELKRLRPHVRFLILGATTADHQRHMKAALLSEAAKLGLVLDKDLIILDPRDEVAKLAQTLDIFWLTSRWEGIPTAIEEAMALAIPVVAFNAGSICEAVEDGVTGFVVPAGGQAALIGASVRLIDDLQLRVTMGDIGRRRALERFGASCCAEVQARAFLMAVQQHSNGSRERISRVL